MGLSAMTNAWDFAEQIEQNNMRNGVNYGALVHHQNLIGCKLFKSLVDGNIRVIFPECEEILIAMVRAGRVVLKCG